MKYKDALPKIHKEAVVLETAVVVGDVSLDKQANVWFNATVRGDMAPITIGEGTNIQDNAVVHTDSNFPTVIGKFVTVGHSAIVHAATIKDHALIGMGSIILNGAVIGEGALVGAGCLVPPGKIVPPRTIVVGNPMRVLKEISQDQVQKNIDNAYHYIELSKVYL